MKISTTLLFLALIATLASPGVQGGVCSNDFLDNGNNDFINELTQENRLADCLKHSAASPDLNYLFKIRDKNGKLLGSFFIKAGAVLQVLPATP